MYQLTILTMEPNKRLLIHWVVSLIRNQEGIWSLQPVLWTMMMSMKINTAPSHQENKWAQTIQWNMLKHNRGLLKHERATSLAFLRSQPWAQTTEKLVEFRSRTRTLLVEQVLTQCFHPMASTILLSVMQMGKLCKRSTTKFIIMWVITINHTKNTKTDKWLVRMKRLTTSLQKATTVVSSVNLLEISQCRTHGQLITSLLLSSQRRALEQALVHRKVVVTKTTQVAV